MAAAARTSTRFYRFRKITIDDIFLVLAVLFFAASTVVIHISKPLIYHLSYLNLGLLIPIGNFNPIALRYSILDNLATIFVWSSLFSVKISFLLFFKQLIERVRHIQIWWWIVFSLVCAAAPVNMFMGFFICPNFTLELSEACPTASIVSNTITYLYTSCILDILTDLIVLSIPVALLWNVKIDLRRKLALITVLGLSIFMIAIAIVRVSLVKIGRTGAPATQPDNIWLFFWQNIEAATAIIMVSVTAFRSMLGQKSTTSKGSKSSKASKGSSTTSASGSRRWIPLKAIPATGDKAPLNKAQIVRTTEISNSYNDHYDDKSFTMRSPV